jgi:phage-related protein
VGLPRPPVVVRTVGQDSDWLDDVYVFHAFQKKSKRGIATPKTEMDLIEKRLKDLINEKERQL